jgi:riboflavin biosynthesis pyrimidine reductase
MMRRLLPSPADDVDLVEAYTPTGNSTGGRFPWVRVNMVSSLDGAISVRGRSGALGGPPDRRLFMVLRSLADVIVVGAGTMRAEGYGPARLDDELRAGRQARGQPPEPPIAVITRSCHFDWQSPFFTEATARPIVFTVDDAVEGPGSRGAEVAEIVTVGETEVDLRRALTALGERGMRHALVEGGPGLNAQLAHARLLDELCLTLSPRVVAGDGPRVLAGPELPQPLEPRVIQLLEDEGFLFLRMACI